MLFPLSSVFLFLPSQVSSHITSAGPPIVDLHSHRSCKGLILVPLAQPGSEENRSHF
jgi:hypothetical protein